MRQFTIRRKFNHFSPKQQQVEQDQVVPQLQEFEDGAQACSQQDESQPDDQVVPQVTALQQQVDLPVAQQQQAPQEAPEDLSMQVVEASQQEEQQDALDQQVPEINYEQVPQQQQQQQAVPTQDSHHQQPFYHYNIEEEEEKRREAVEAQWLSFLQDVCYFRDNLQPGPGQGLNLLYGIIVRNVGRLLALGEDGYWVRRIWEQAERIKGIIRIRPGLGG